ncbi:MAG: sulfotransferase domain-containing protein [Bacteroidota bacterium]
MHTKLHTLTLEKPSSSKSILVTGSHRSGSSWVGETLCHSAGLNMLWEPFNLEARPGVAGGVFKHWFTYISEENEEQYLPALKKSFAYKYQLLKDLQDPQGLRAMYRSSRNMLHYYRARRSKRNMLIKDPIALFSAPYLAKTFDLEVLVMIRHPAAFVSSIKKANWPFPFAHLLEQPLLVGDLLYPFRAEIETFSKKDQPLIDQGILLWNIFHSLILTYKKDHPNWIFLRHEDLSRNPLAGFKALSQELNLPFSPNAEKFILASTGSSNSTEQKKLSDTRRNSAGNIKNWKKRLSAEEIYKIKCGTLEVSPHFYSEKDW